MTSFDSCKTFNDMKPSSMTANERSEEAELNNHRTERFGFNLNSLSSCVFHLLQILVAAL